jgi:hypothetical protein
MWQFADASPVLQRTLRMIRSWQQRCQRADYLVTGDLRLQRRVPSFQGIPLVLAADFLDILIREP